MLDERPHPLRIVGDAAEYAPCALALWLSIRWDLEVLLGLFVPVISHRQTTFRVSSFNTDWCSPMYIWICISIYEQRDACCSERLGGTRAVEKGVFSAR